MTATARIPDGNIGGFDLMDRMPADVRRCVHDFGMAPVQALWLLGIRDARHIRHAINSVRLGAREPANRPHRVNGHNEALIDDFLIQRCGQAFARELVAFLRANSQTVIPIEPTVDGIFASMHAVGAISGGVERSRHTRMLRDAIRATDVKIWGPRV